MAADIQNAPLDASSNWQQPQQQQPPANPEPAPPSAPPAEAPPPPAQFVSPQPLISASPENEEAPIGKNRGYSVFSVVTDILLFIVCAAGMIAGSKMQPPPRADFFCVPDYSYGYLEEARRHVTMPVLASFAGICFVVPVLLVEAARAFGNIGPPLADSQFMAFVVGIYKYSGSGLVGLLLNIFLSGVTKRLVTSPAPNFLEACNPPEKTALMRACRRSLAMVSTYGCQGNGFIGPDSLDVEYSKMSFYSTFCTVSMHSAVYASLYLHERVSHNVFGIAARPVVQVFLISVSLFIGYCRYVENLNHAIDIAVGFAFGIGTAFFAAVCVAHMFCESEEEENAEKTVVAEAGAAPGLQGPPMPLPDTNEGAPMEEHSEMPSAAQPLMTPSSNDGGMPVATMQATAPESDINEGVNTQPLSAMSTTKQPDDAESNMDTRKGEGQDTVIATQMA